MKVFSILNIGLEAENLYQEKEKFLNIRVKITKVSLKRVTVFVTEFLKKNS